MPRNGKNGTANNRRHSTPQSLNAYVKSICDIMRRGGAAGALQYVPELTWMLFLRILDETEEREMQAAQIERQMKHARQLRAPAQSQLDAINALPAAYLRRAFRGEL